MLSSNLPEGIDLVFYDLNSLPNIGELESVLSKQELIKAHKMSSTGRRELFIKGRSLLKKQLAAALKTPVHELELVEDSRGKLFCNHPIKSVFFSLSHSQNNLLIAMSTSYKIGVDLEIFDESNDMTLLARHLYSEQEQLELSRLTKEDSQKRALEIWCLKEALFKMNGSSVQLKYSKNFKTAWVTPQMTYTICWSRQFS